MDHRNVTRTEIAGSRRGDAGQQTIRLLPATLRGIVAAPPAVATPDPDQLRLRQLSHDIRHGLGTVLMLATLLTDGDDIGPQGRRRAGQLLTEARWLEELQNAYLAGAAPASPSPVPIRLDVCARETVAVLELSCATGIEVSTCEVWAAADRLALHRALRNIVGNALRAAGPGGRVAVSVEQSGDWAVARVDDNGPGFGAASSGMASMGLDIVLESVAACGGRLEIRRGDLGGCCVCLSMPASRAPDDAATDAWSVLPALGGIDAAADL